MRVGAKQVTWIDQSPGGERRLGSGAGSAPKSFRAARETWPCDATETGTAEQAERSETETLSSCEDRGWHRGGGASAYAVGEALELRARR